MRFASWARLALAGLTLFAGAAGAETDAPFASARLRAFTTSISYDADLGGLAGADAKCTARATAAGLFSPTGFIAWLSSSASDAYCRVHGLNAKRVDNCGQATLPASAGPWVRTDGFPFADRIDLALWPTGRVLTPLNLDEFGATIATDYAWTNTNQFGASVPDYPTPCGDWSSASSEASVAAGSSWSTTLRWTQDTSRDCSDLLPLICLERGAGLPLPAHRSGGAQAFVTSVTGTGGDLGSWPEAGDATGLAAGDAICQSLATTAGLPSPISFRAWLSTSTVDAKDHIHFAGPWIRLDGVRIADSKADLVDGELHTTMNQTEIGEYDTSATAWTGTGADGLALPQNCGDWTSTEVWGWAGWGFLAHSEWTERSTYSCDYANGRLYCFSVFPAILFVDDFESSDCDAWSLTQPAD
jgi:hypothetical protein